MIGRRLARALLALLLLFALAFAALAAALRPPAPLVALPVLANASPRYRIPLVSLLLIGTGAAACQWRDLAARLRHPRALPALAVLLFFLAVSVPSFIPDVTKLWNRGTVFESP